ncbi:MAG: hypothetical protein KJ000_31845 [Pirellulaceae bacterium]|nr:hypothetical protein [Pirellulaceae bacterium]
MIKHGEANGSLIFHLICPPTRKYKEITLAFAPLDGNGIATSAKDLGVGIGGVVGGYAYNKSGSKAIEGSVFDV